MSDGNRPPIKKVASINNQILEYYHKFGQNRDLERYLRLRQNYNKSSSEGSISTPSCASASRVPSRESKSLDQLNFAKGTCSDEEVHTEEEQAHIVRKEVSPQKDVVTSPLMARPEVKMKTKSFVTKPKKSYTFNCESNIAISLPFTQTASMPELVPRPETATEYSQTDFDEQKLNQSIGYEEENVSQTKSPDNNVKTSKRLEWDSLGDVGYEKEVALNKNQSRSMSTLEKSVLRDFFAEKGIEIKFTSESENGLNRLPKIQEETPAKTTQGAIPKTPRERWRETLESMKQKYTNQSSSVNSSQNNFSRFRKLTSTQHSTPKVEILEKFCQTSFIKTQSKEIQVDFSNGGSIKSTLDAGSVTSPSSFEYFPHISNDQENSDKENISPRTLNKENECKLRQRAKKLLERQNATLQSNNATTDLELGIKLLCSLIESKSLNDKQKKSLARKIVTKITKGNNLPLSQNSTSSSSAFSKASLIGSAKQPAVVENVSGVETLSSTSSKVNTSHSRPASDESNKSVETSRRMVQMQPEDSSSGHSTTEKGDVKNASGKNSEKTSSFETSGEHKSEVLKAREEIRKSEERILKKNENKNDNTMNEWLEPLTKSEIEYQRKKSGPNEVSNPKPVDVRGGGDGTFPGNRETNNVMQFIKEEKRSHLKWIENEIERLENLKLLLLTNEDSGKEKNQIKAEEIVAYPVQIEKVPDDLTKPERRSRPSSSCKDANLGNKIYDVTRTESEVEVINPTQNYRRKIKRISEEIKSNDNSAGKESKPIKITTFSIEEEKRFPKKDYVCSEDEKYRREERSKLETPQSCVSESIRSYAKQRKSEFLENYRKTPIRLYDQPAESDHYSEPKEAGLKQRFPTSNAYTSVSSSDFFISSDSVSIPISASSSTTTTTHQYDNRVAVGVQTTDSILRTKPIYSTKFACGCMNKCECKIVRPTIREYRPKPSKQVQAHPPPLAYVITFDNDAKKSEDSQGSAESLTLQEHLEKRRPDFQQRASERQKILKKLHKLRYERQAKIKEIVDNTSMSSISRKMKDLPPPPTKYTRIFPTKEMKAMTRRKYSKLPEVIAKVERERNERKKKSNKVLADMFNRRLLRRVHKGKLTLEHSRTVI